MTGGRLKREIIVNLILSTLKVGTLMWVIRLAGLFFSPATLGLFLLARRLSSTGANLLGLGVSPTLLRYVSMNINVPATKGAYVYVAVLIWAGLAVVVLPLCQAFSGPLAAWAFPGSRGTEDLAFWAGTLTIAMISSFLVYSTLLAERWIVTANVVEFMSAGGFLLIVMLWDGTQVTPVAALRFQAIGCAGVSAVGLACYLRRNPWRRDSRSPDGLQVLRVFLGYGIPRGAVTFLETTIFLIGPWLLRTELEETGFLLVALVPVQMVQLGITPIAQVASLAAARAIGSGATAAEHVRLLFGAVVYGTMLTVGVLLPWAPHLLRLWLGDPDVVANVARHFVLLAWGIPALAVFQGLKGVIDACWFRPLNLYTLLFGIATQVSAFLLFKPFRGPVEAVRLSLLAALWALGFATAGWLASTYLRPVRQWGFLRLAAVSLGLFWLNSAIADEFSVAQILVALCASASIAVLTLTLVSPAPIVKSLLVVLRPGSGNPAQAE